MNVLPDPLFFPAVEVVRDGLPDREVMRKHAPGAPSPQRLPDGVQDFPAIVLGRTSALGCARLGRRNQGFEHRPFGIGQVGRVVGSSAHASSLPELLTQR